MAFTVARNAFSLSNPQRQLEDRLWSSSSSVSSQEAAAPPHQRVGNAFIGRVKDLLSPNRQALSMFKDKPYGYDYGPSRRPKPLYRRKGLMALLIMFALGALWLMRGWKRHSQTIKTAADWSGGLKDDGTGKVNWRKRREMVVEAFELSWTSYTRNAWGYDEYHPVAKTGNQMAPKGMGWIIIDALDTMMLMNLTSCVQHAREWLSGSLTWDQDQSVNTFETTIRMVGGLLSAHYLSTEFPDMAPLQDDNPGKPGEDLYLEKARDLADRLLAAFGSPSGVPYASVNLAQLRGFPSHTDGGASSTSEATTLQLEFKYLAKLTGEKLFWEKAEKVMEVVDNLGARDGLVPIYISAINGEFRGDYIRLGSRGDSYYEYLIKQYLQTNKQETIYQDMWRDAMTGVRKHLVTYTKEAQLTIIGERPDGLNGHLSPKMDHLVCFMPGTIALAATGGLPLAEARKLPTWSKQDEADMQLARELAQTCWAMYKYMATGLAPEIIYFKINNPPPAETDPHQPPFQLSDDPDAPWRRDLDVHLLDLHNLQRPETVESLFYLWRITGDPEYCEWGWDMFQSFMEHTVVEDGGGFSSLSNANVIPPVFKDNMESFWLAETLKYFYLLFSPGDLLPLDKVIFNTEAHPLPRFDMGQLFETGWKRKPRDADGNLVIDKLG